jgi:hypothetical protein
MTDYEVIVNYGPFALTGEPAGAEGLWLHDIVEHVRLRDPHALTSPAAIATGLLFGSTSLSDITYGPAIVEALRLNSTADTALIWSYLIADSVAIDEALQLSFGASCADGVNLSQTTSVALAITVAQALFLPSTVSTTLNFNLWAAEAVQLSTAFGNFLGVNVAETATLTAALTPLWRPGMSIAEGVSLTAAVGESLVLRVDCADGAWFDDTMVLQYIFRGIVSEVIEITAGYISPSGSFTTWAINTRTSAVTEYQNFAFDSFAQVGRKVVAGDVTGLYELNGESDAGSPVVADILSGFLQVGGSRFTAFKAAYLGLSSKSGQFVLKLITGDDQTYVYAVTAQNMRTTRVNLGKGLSSRYFRFELINADGKDFSMNAIEFIPLIRQRRV